MIRFKVIRIESEFIEDYESLPKKIQKRVDRRLSDWSITGELPPSAQAHKTVLSDIEYVIVYISCGLGAYRMLANVIETDLICYRVGDHEKMERILGLGN